MLSTDTKGSDWEATALLSYIPRPLVQKLRYVIIRAGELKINGQDDSRNGFLKAINTLMMAMYNTLVAEGFTPDLEPSDPDGAMTASHKVLSDKVAAQEDELIKADEHIESLESQIERLKEELAKASKKTATKSNPKKGGKK